MTINPRDLRLFYHPEGMARLTVANDRSYVRVKLAIAAPLSRPNQYVSLLDSKGEEIVLLRNLDQLDPASHRVAERELQRRYLTSQIRRLVSLKQEFGVTYWEADTHRGVRDFVVRDLQENCVWLSETHLLLIDVDGSRFEIPDRRLLDERSQQLLDAIL
jgi:Domain of unknown function (DUF1854)